MPVLSGTPIIKIIGKKLKKYKSELRDSSQGTIKWKRGNTKLNLDSLEWPTLEERRLQTKLTIFQKARLKLIDIPTDHLTFKNRQTRRGGDGQTYQRYHSDVGGHIYSFFPHTTNLWNHLPLNVRMSLNIEEFTSEVNKIDLTSMKQRMSVKY